MRRRRAALVTLSALLAATPAGAQRASRSAPPRPEVRVDYLGPRPHALHVGAGVNVPFGTYVRVGLIGGAGTSWDDGRAYGSARADVVARFALDPFRERRWGLSAGGGFGARYEAGAPSAQRRWRALVTLVLDLEGPRTGAWAPAVQVGLGGGARVGLVLRGADPERR